MRHATHVPHLAQSAWCLHDHRVGVDIHEDHPTEAKRCKLAGEGVSKEVGLIGL